jgi:AAA+ superfamily predicted ATPase
MDRKEYGTGITAAKQFWQKKDIRINTDERLIDAAGYLFTLRQSIDGDRDLARAERKASERFHWAIQKASKDMYLPQVFRQHKLTRIEQEILLAVIAGTLGLCENPGNLVGIQGMMHRETGVMLQVRRAIGVKGRLVKNDFIDIEISRGESPKVSLGNELLNKLVYKKQRSKSRWNVHDYNGCLNLLKDLVKVASDKANAVETMQEIGEDDNEFMPQNESILRFYGNMRRLCTKNPKWPISWLMKQTNLCQEERMVVLVLLGKELGFGRHSDDLATGQGLAGVMCYSLGDFRKAIDSLKCNSALVKHGYIQACGGLADDVVQEDDWTLRGCRFELTDGCMEKLKVSRRRKSIGAARPAKVKMEQLVLSEKVRRALAMCAAQAKHSKVLLEDWGLGERFSYGSSVAMLFSGPPGTGKTACAEALAGELGKPIMVMNYAELQNCWVGQTEKNVVKAFREASRQDAVLFWDEADAVFGDRDRAHQNWEVREVNVLLQELERFKGVCILATNRKMSLDKALDRRIAMKVEFERPAGPERLEIWRRMLPKRMPLGKDVDIRELAEEDLSGGQIKNVIMNAARMAIASGPKAKVTQAEFAKALAMERSGGWAESRGAFGFGKRGA